MERQLSPQAVIEGLQAAVNRHDLEGMLALFDPGYRSEQPAHPERAFGGREQVRKNWSALFDSVPDLRSELLGVVSAGDTAWAEWHWHGRRSDGTRFAMRGVTIGEIREGRITWMRLYMELVEEGGEGIDATMENLTRRREDTETGGRGDAVKDK